jgi:CAAD domains of cyanobacterial aminoacyl-tRNA synthetase
METQVKQQEYIDNFSETAVESENTAPDTQVEQVSADVDNQVQRISQQVSDFFAELPDKISRFYQEYKLPVISFALLVIAIITLRIGVAIVGTVNDIPFVKPLFELIGMGYTFWFTYRYLLKESTRKELFGELSLMKKQIVGKTTSESPIESQQL